MNFDELSRLGEKGVQTLLKNTPRDILILALIKTTTENLKFVLNNLSEREREYILEDIFGVCGGHQGIGEGIPLKYCEIAQMRILNEVLKLYEAGEIEIEGWNNTTMVCWSSFPTLANLNEFEIQFTTND